jgi:hypothetical protein
VRRGGAPGAFGRRTTDFSDAPHGSAGARSRVRSNKFHVQDLQHFPQVLEVADKIRELALRRSTPACSHHAVAARINDNLQTMSEGEIVSALRCGRIIELNDGPEHNDCRMLVRDEHGVCVVYSVGLHRIITCWWNDPADEHKTLDLTNYKRLKVGSDDPSVRASAQSLRRLIACGHSHATAPAPAPAHTHAPTREHAFA